MVGYDNEVTIDKNQGSLSNRWNSTKCFLIQILNVTDLFNLKIVFSVWFMKIKISISQCIMFFFALAVI